MALYEAVCSPGECRKDTLAESHAVSTGPRSQVPGGPRLSSFCECVSGRVELTLHRVEHSREFGQGKGLTRRKGRGLRG